MQIAETTLLKKNQIQRITFNNFQKILKKINKYSNNKFLTLSPL